MNEEDYKKVIAWQAGLLAFARRNNRERFMNWWEFCVERQPNVAKKTFEIEQELLKSGTFIPADGPLWKPKRKKK